ncbi:bile acid:sodium symporter family protein [Timonella senegalensis]|uniref:bile acid:sodium symporter family protein n=2 Tax=Timonella senegalensis TaxID=1465825 RepID=UPI0028A7B824|nr:bile acid:sodium symporter family protein [Timonella senegalensis]
MASSTSHPRPGIERPKGFGPWLMSVLKRIDPFLAALIGAVVLASFFPVRGQAAEAFDVLVVVAVAWLFFLYGVRLKTSEAIAALKDWRLHSVVLACTYVLFPLVGLACMLIPDAILPHELKLGVLFMTLLPSTVQSSIAFVSIARGNVAGAVVAASFSNLAGVVITPLLVAGLMGAQVGFSASAIGKIALQLLLPFVLGQLVRRWLADWVIRHRRLTTFTDRGSVVLVVYSAFSRGVVDGIWTKVSVGNVVTLLILSAIVLALMLGASNIVGKKMGFSRADQAVILMCGSKKSLATGVPMATVLFSAATVGMMVLPIMIFHQLQLIVCAVIARRLGARAEPQPVTV